MKEVEWWLSNDPGQLIHHIREGTAVKGRRCRRRLRLFACSVSGTLYGTMSDARSRQAFEAAERYADRCIPFNVLEELHQHALVAAVEKHGPDDWAEQAAVGCSFSEDLAAAEWAAWFGFVPGDAGGEVAKRAARIREIFGNPFRHPLREYCEPCAATGIMYDDRSREQMCFACNGEGYVAIDTTPWIRWHDGIIPETARRFYTGRTFDEMPILADMLEDAGAVPSCASPTGALAVLLAHLRGREPCVGCSVGYGNPSMYGGGGGPCRACGQTGDTVGWMPLRAPHALGCWALDVCRGEAVIPGD